MSADPLAGRRDALNRGELDHLSWEDHGQGKPVEVGQTFKLRSGGIEITRVRRERSGTGWWWIAEFTRFHPESRLYLLDRKGGYTESPREAMLAQEDELPADAPEPEAVPPHEVAGYTGSKQARRRYEAEVAQAQAELDRLPLSERLRALEQGAEQGADVSRFLGAIENRIKAGEKRLGLRKAS